MLDWNKSQWEAFGRHVLTAVSSVVATLVMINVIPAAKAGEFVAHATNLINAVIGLAAIMAPILAGIAASRSASRERQVEQVAQAIQNGELQNGTREKIISAVAEIPEVRKVVVKDPVMVDDINNEKVTNT